MKTEGASQLGYSMEKSKKRKFMHFRHVWKEVEGTNRPVALKKTFCPCYFEFIFIPEQCHPFFFFFFQMGCWHASCSSMLHVLHKWSYSSQPSQILRFKTRICGIWWHPMIPQENTAKWQETASYYSDGKKKSGKMMKHSLWYVLWQCPAGPPTLYSLHFMLTVSQTL